MQKKVSLNSAKLSLLTIEYDISDDRPEETEVIHLEPSSEETVSKLVQKRFPALGRVNPDKVAEFAGGNARVAIALASRVDADETLTNFSDEDLFQRLFSQRKGITDSLLESAEILSLMYSFNVSPSEYNDELDVLATIGGLEHRTLNRSHAELLRRQLSQQRGNWRAVLPYALANYVPFFRCTCQARKLSQNEDRRFLTVCLVLATRNIKRSLASCFIQLSRHFNGLRLVFLTSVRVEEIMVGGPKHTERNWIGTQVSLSF